MEEKKEWSVMKVETKPSVEVPNLWGVIKPEDISQKGTGNFKADYMNWALTYHLMHENAPGWMFRLLPWKDQDQPQFIHKAPDGTGYVLGQWIHKESGMMLPEFPQACMNHRNQPIMYEQCDARTLTDTHRRALCTSAAASFGLAGELWARVPVEDPHVEDNAQQGVNPFREEKPAKPKKAKKPSKSKAELTTEYAAGLGVTVDMVLAWSGLESIDAVIAHPEKSKQFKELLQKCKAGANAQELFSVEASTEFNFGEFGDEE